MSNNFCMLGLRRSQSRMSVRRPAVAILVASWLESTLSAEAAEAAEAEAAQAASAEAAGEPAA